MSGPPPDPTPRRGPSRQGLTEYVLVTLFLAIAAAGTVAIFGDELRAAFGVRPPPAAPAPASAARR
jgi:hypothetical protein